VRTPDDFLGAEQLDESHWRFALGRELHGAFGGAFGGAVSACCVRAGRSIASGRHPASLDMRFLRQLPAGEAEVAVSILSSGRTLTTVVADLTGSDGRLDARATIGYVEVSALHPLDFDQVAEPEFSPGATLSGWSSPKGIEIPIVDTLHPRIAGAGSSGIATAVEVPWAVDGYDAETICLPADMCVGPPVAAALDGSWFPHPNPDISLRFSGAVEDAELIGVGRLERLERGLATVSVKVWSGKSLVAVGICSSMVLPPSGR